MAVRKTKEKKTRPKRGAKNKKNVIKVDFEGVESGGGGRPTPDGYYELDIQKVTEEEGEDSGQPYLKGRFNTHIGSVVFDNMSLQSQALWKLRGLLEALGQEVPDAEMEIDIDALVGEGCIGEIMNEDYDSKPQPRVTAYMPIDTVGVELEEKAPEDDDAEPDEPDDDPDDDPDDEPEKKPRPKAKAKAKAKAKQKTAGKLRPGAKVEFEDEDGNLIQGVLESIDGDEATVVDTDDAEWEIPLDELKKA